jgi:hypothetical protein
MLRPRQIAMAAIGPPWQDAPMSPLDDCVQALLTLARANRPEGIWPVNQAVDAFLARSHRSLGDRITALDELKAAFEQRAPANDTTVYAVDVIDQRRRVLQIEWWQRYRSGVAVP